MTKSRMSILILITLSAASLLPVPIGAQVRPLLRISVENHPGHVQTEAVRLFVARLEKELGDRFNIQFYDSGDLFRDRDVLAALAGGKVEIAVPGTWQLDRFVPSVSTFLLPTFFGRSARFVHALSDGSVGARVADGVEEALPVKVFGRWLDLGPAHLYFTDRQISSHTDMKGLTIRIAGGVANELRMSELGARPITIAWADLPTQLRSGLIDGTLTTHESVRSGELWEYGISVAIEDHEYFPQYVPLIRESLWRRLCAADRASIEEIWDSIVDEQRLAAAEAQRSARQALVEHGVEIREPDESDLERLRRRLILDEPAIAERLGIPSELYQLLLEATR